MQDIQTFLRAAAQRPFSYGEWDCLQWLGLWIEARRGFNPAAEWVGSYQDAREARRIIWRAGGVVAHIDQVLSPFGIVRTIAPQPGDIAVTDTPDGKLGAIVTSKGAASIGMCGLRIHRSPVLAAWRV